MPQAERILDPPRSRSVHFESFWEFSIPRLIVILLPIAWVGCATSQTAKRAELVELSAQVRALRDENVRLSKRVEQLEAKEALLRARLSSTEPRAEGAAQLPPAPAPSAGVPSGAMPELAVVRLRPKKGALPKLSTQVEVVEPSPTVLDDLATARDEPSEPVDPRVIDAEYDSALASMKTGDLSGGVQKLVAFADAYPKNARADNALYLAGVGLFGLEEFDPAARLFERVLKQYPAGDTVTEAMLKLGECRLRLNQTTAARDVFQKVVASYPGTPAAQSAQSRLASLH